MSQLALNLSGTIVRVVSLTNDARRFLGVDDIGAFAKMPPREEALRNEVCLETGVFLLLAVDTNPRRTVKTRRSKTLYRERKNAARKTEREKEKRMREKERQRIHGVGNKVRARFARILLMRST